MVALLQQSPALAADDSVLRWWAFAHHPQAYQQLQNQEFRLQPLLSQARQELTAAAAATPPHTVRVIVPVSFGSYDFARQRFPLQLGFNQLTLPMSPCCVPSQALPGSVQISLSGLDMIDGLPMPAAAAQAFLDRRTSRNQSVDRGLVLLMTLKLDPQGIAVSRFGQASASGTLQAVVVLSGEATPELLHRFSAGDLQALVQEKASRDAAADRAAQQQRQQAARAAQAQQAQADREQRVALQQQRIAQLSAEPPSVRLATAIAPSGDMAAAPLDNLRMVRERALLTGEATDVAMLVQIGARDGAEVATEWPGHLSIMVPRGSSAWRRGAWVLVSGRLTVPPGDALPAALLQPLKAIVCDRPRCADAAEPETIVRRQLAAAALP